MIEEKNRLDAAKKLVVGHKVHEKQFINILADLKKTKQAVKYVKEFSLDPQEFPNLIQ